MWVSIFIRIWLHFRHGISDDLHELHRFFATADDLIGWEHKPMSTCITQLNCVRIFQLHCSLRPVVTSSCSWVQRTSSRPNRELFSINFLYGRGAFLSNSFQLLVIWRNFSVIAPWVQDVLTIAVERQRSLKVRSRRSQKVLNRFRFWNKKFRLKLNVAARCLLTWFTERASSGECFSAGLSWRSLSAPFVSVISVEVDAHAESIASSILSPQTVICMRKLVTVWIHNWQEIPIDVLNAFTLLAPILGECVDYECYDCWWNPFTSLQKMR